MGVKTQRISISLTSLGIGREKKRSNPEGQKELDLETQISMSIIYELLQAYDYFLYPAVVSAHRTSSWEPLANIWDGVPQFVKSELRKLRLDRGLRSRLQTFHDNTL